MQKSHYKIDLREYITKHYREKNVGFEVLRDENDSLRAVNIFVSPPQGGRQGFTQSLSREIYDAEGDVVDKELLVEELKAIVSEHNAKYENE